ncbi:hypothetical protein L3Q82_020978 [Scortum barcoo]|uniref:Uncharacterized protein n=1 Tax=Scortum barcoo TaxID=214431 RepID=A0ACB8V911_9TELE|nr:hypothetical protein L3Q82_020978 [Scortum barcoo]
MPSGDGKSDMERLGVFKEMSYISIGDKYAPPTNRPFNASAYCSRQMQVGIPKQRCALQSGFFDKTFKRVFEREALSNPLRLARQNRIQQAKKNLGKAFLPCNGVKKPCGSGSYYGTLSGPVEAMSPLSVTRRAHHSPGRNIVTSPPKKGSGYRFIARALSEVVYNSFTSKFKLVFQLDLLRVFLFYPNVTLSKLELYASDPYSRAQEVLKREAAIHRSKLRDGPFKLNLHPRDYFQSNPYCSDKPLPPAHKPLPPAQKDSPVPFKPPSPSKKIGGMKAGTFDTYPLHSADPFTVRCSKPTNQEPIFRPAPGPKSTPVKSIITVNVNRFDANLMFPVVSLMLGLLQSGCSAKLVLESRSCLKVLGCDSPVQLPSFSHGELRREPAVMSRYLKYFTTVGDQQPAQLEEEELHEASEELSAATGLFPTTLTFRESLQRLYSSDRFQVVVVCLVILDAIFVLAELLIDLSVIKVEHGHVAPEVFHYLSLALLTFFMVELGGKLFAYRLEFFQHRFEVFDGAVVVVSFVLDIVFIFHEDAFDGMGLLILLRLWRVARIINGILVSVKTRAHQKIHKLKESYDHLVQRVSELQERSDKLEQENQKLQALLKKHNIDF